MFQRACAGTSPTSWGPKIMMICLPEGISHLGNLGWRPFLPDLELQVHLASPKGGVLKVAEKLAIGKTMEKPWLFPFFSQGAEWLGAVGWLKNMLSSEFWLFLFPFQGDAELPKKLRTFWTPPIWSKNCSLVRRLDSFPVFSVAKRHSPKRSWSLKQFWAEKHAFFFLGLLNVFL